MPLRPLLALTAAAALLAGCAGGSAPSAAAQSGARSGASSAGATSAGASSLTQAAAGTISPSPRRPCGFGIRPHYRHVVWIWMENRSYDSVLGSSPAAPHLAHYADRCGVATNYDAVSHPSLPNYVAAVAGSTFGITTDCTPDTCSLRHSSVFQQLTKTGKGWRGYAESMQQPCDQASYGTYAARHNPAVYFTPIRHACLRRDRAFGGSSGRFADDLSAASLPAFSFVTPNLCHDGHDCATSVADDWLGHWLGRIVSSPQYADGRTAVFVTWDEGVVDNHVATVVIAPTVPRGTRAGRHFTHYSLLRTAEQLLRLPYLRKAGSAHSMAAPFNLK